ncbi:MAG TPA: VOC family protein, partial [Candidatus Eisenbacteria bacterium]
MPEVTKYEPGNFCWPELATSDPDGAKRFYAGLFGWSAEDSPAGPDMVYTMLRQKGKNVGALYRIRPDQK